MTRDVLITGLGVLGPFGVGPLALAEALTSGVDDFLPWPDDEADGLRVARMTDFVFRDWVRTRNKRTKKMDRVAQYASTGALLALRDAGFVEDQGPLAPELGEDFGIVTGSALAVMESIAAFHGQLATEGPDRVDPKLFPNTSHNVPCAHVTIEFGLHGPMLNVCSGPSSGTMALVMARDMIARGRATRLLVGGYDHLGDTVLTALAAEGEGLRLTEGAAFLVLEEAEAAAARGANLRGRVLGGVLGHGDAWERTLVRLREKTGGADRDLGGVLRVSEARGGRREAEALAQVGHRGAMVSLDERIGEALAAGGPMAVCGALLALEGRLDGIDLGVPRTAGEDGRAVLVSDSGADGRGGAILLG